MEGRWVAVGQIVALTRFFRDDVHGHATENAGDSSEIAIHDISAEPNGLECLCASV
ncbi:unannotated protein [freshwater metagenome]|uniref:Unannotated protein n=1 Tax=freshwater metagenome TaxID=449393 RepID=A0A6J6B1X7_9ZZZZ